MVKTRRSLPNETKDWDRSQYDDCLLYCRPRDVGILDQKVSGWYLTVARDAEDGRRVRRRRHEVEVGVILAALWVALRRRTLIDEERKTNQMGTIRKRKERQDLGNFFVIEDRPLGELNLGSDQMIEVHESKAEYQRTFGAHDH
jgi:hypothetical protein